MNIYAEISWPTILSVFIEKTTEGISLVTVTHITDGPYSADNFTQKWTNFENVIRVISSENTI